MNEKRTNEKLYSFVRTGDVEDVLKLIEDGVDINCKDEYGNDALFYAVVHYRLDVIKLLIEKGANCEIVYNDKKNILHIAVESDCEEKGFFEIIPILFNKKTNIDEQDKYGNTPLSYACVYYVVNEKTIKYFLENGADMDIKNLSGNSVYSTAISNNRTELQSILDKYRR